MQVPGPIEQLRYQKLCSTSPSFVDYGFEGVKPFSRFIWVYVWKLVYEAIKDHEVYDRIIEQESVRGKQICG